MPSETETLEPVTIPVEAPTEHPIDTDHGDHDRFAHYCRKADITRALVTGEAIVALCGKKWVPTQRPVPIPGMPDVQRAQGRGLEALTARGGHHDRPACPSRASSAGRRHRGRCLRDDRADLRDRRGEGRRSRRTDRDRRARCRPRRARQRLRDRLLRGAPRPRGQLDPRRDAGSTARRGVAAAPAHPPPGRRPPPGARRPGSPRSPS